MTLAHRPRSSAQEADQPQSVASEAARRSLHRPRREGVRPRAARGTGRTKTWTLRYRVRGEQRRLRLGVYPRSASPRRASGRTRTPQGRWRDRSAGRTPAAAPRGGAGQARQHRRALRELHRAAREAEKRTWRDDQGKIKTESCRSGKAGPCRRSPGATAASWCRRSPIAARPSTRTASRRSLAPVPVRGRREIIEANPAAELPKPGVEPRAGRRASARRSRTTRRDPRHLDGDGGARRGAAGHLPTRPL